MQLKKRKKERLPKLVLKALWRQDGGIYLEIGQNLKFCGDVGNFKNGSI